MMGLATGFYGPRPGYEGLVPDTFHLHGERVGTLYIRRWLDVEGPFPPHRLPDGRVLTDEVQRGLATCCIVPDTSFDGETLWVIETTDWNDLEDVRSDVLLCLAKGIENGDIKKKTDA